MMTNLKLDIIYYKTSSDFELEFNLSGCCRMRIFKDKAESPKELVTALARDVARSRIILIVSDLLGEKNGVEVICSSIGYDYKSVDKSAYSILTEGEIKAPAGSLPLVTKTGQYGGFILESGKQSIIVVSSDRTLRHEVMKLYVHQYIFDINQVEAYNERLRHESEHNPIIDGSNILSSARQEFASVTEAVSLAEGVMLLTPFSADAADQQTQKFVATYQQKFGEVPNQFAADAYDCIYAIYQACQKAGITVDMTAAQINEKMKEQFNTMTFSGLTGENMTWKDGYVSKSPKGMEIQNGVYVGLD